MIFRKYLSFKFSIVLSLLKLLSLGALGSASDIPLDGKAHDLFTKLRASVTSYQTSHRNIDMCIGGIQTNSPEGSLRCPKSLREGEILFRIPDKANSIVILLWTKDRLREVRSSTQSVFAFQMTFPSKVQPHPLRVDNRCFYVYPQTIERIEDTDLKNCSPSKTAKGKKMANSDIYSLSSEVITRISADLKGQLNEFQRRAPASEDRGGQIQYKKLLDFKDSSVREMLEALEKDPEVKKKESLVLKIKNLQTLLDNRAEIAKQAQLRPDSKQDPRLGKGVEQLNP